MSNKFSKNINELIEKNNDAFKGFDKAADKAENHRLKSFLNQQSSQRKQFAQELTNELRTADPDFEADNDGSVTGSLHRTWMDVKSALSGDNDEAILEECLRGEKAARDEYKEALDENHTLPTNLQSKLRDHLKEINSTLSRVNRLEDLN